MFFRKKRRTVDCKGSLLFEILEEDLSNGLCTDIRFKAFGKKHCLGAWGDAGNTYKNVVFYFDDYECNSLDELKQNAMLNRNRLIDSSAVLTVSECNGCYPESTPQLQKILEQSNLNCNEALMGGER